MSLDFYTNRYCPWSKSWNDCLETGCFQNLMAHDQGKQFSMYHVTCQNRFGELQKKCEALGEKTEFSGVEAATSGPLPSARIMDIRPPVFGGPPNSTTAPALQIRPADDPSARPRVGDVYTSRFSMARACTYRREYFMTEAEARRVLGSPSRGLKIRYDDVVDPYLRTLLEHGDFWNTDKEATQERLNELTKFNEEGPAVAVADFLKRHPELEAKSYASGFIPLDEAQ